jgi:hypothetical protein
VRNEANISEIESNVVSMLDIIPIIMIIGPIAAIIAKVHQWFGKKERVPGKIKRGNMIEYGFN